MTRLKIAAAVLAGAALAFTAGNLAGRKDGQVAASAPAPVQAAAAQEAPAPSVPDAWLTSAWPAYKTAFVRNGRVLDDVNRVSHSEGQGYGMLIATLADDREAFDEIWAWTRRELFIRNDGLAAWRWEERASPHVTDANNATDGDILIAWALAEAAERWKSADYAQDARQIVSAVARKTLARWQRGTVILPAATGFGAGDQSDGPVVNLSYWVFPAFDRLARTAPDVPWAELRASGLLLAQAARFSLVRLPPDWLSLAGTEPKPAQGFPARFGYNAIRIPLYLAWASRGDAEPLRPFAGLWNEARSLGPFEIDLTTGEAVSTMEGAGYRAVAALVSCALDGQPMPASLRTVPIQTYYSTTLHILALAATQQGYAQCLSRPS